MKTQTHQKIDLPMIYFFILLFPFVIFASELPKPDVTVPILMRDGTKLSTDIYFPTKDIVQLPCIVVRSPAGRTNPYALMFLSLLQEGYTVAIQETRNVKDPEGKTLPYLSDGWGKEQDGYDTLAYLEKSPYTNGKIGTVGASAMGITQLLMGPTAPPGLKAQYISFATADLFNHGLYEGGELCKDQVEKWLGLYAHHPDVYRKIYTQPHYNAYWENFNMLPHCSKCKTPAIHVGGWYDVFLKGSLAAYTHLQNEGGEGAKGAQKLVVGPWSHLWPFNPKLGDYDYPEAALNPPHDFSPKHWFATHLKGEPTELAPVTYYVMGTFDGSPSSGNVWKTATEWPVPYTVKPIYFSQGYILAKSPSSRAEEYTYSYDPENPVPTIGGRNLFLSSGPIDQRQIENREDVLVFTTEPLEEDFEITGPLNATLFVNTDQEDTAFSVRLTDVYPDGTSLLIAEGITRLSHAASPTTPKEIEVDLAATSMVFAKGHKIRILVSSSNYPKYEKNYNSLKQAYENPTPVVAKNTLFTGATAPSRINFPIVLTNE